jgi:hypothetical protein
MYLLHIQDYIMQSQMGYLKFRAESMLKVIYICEMYLFHIQTTS